MLFIFVSYFTERIDVATGKALVKEYLPKTWSSQKTTLKPFSGRFSGKLSAINRVAYGKMFFTQSLMLEELQFWSPSSSG